MINLMYLVLTALLALNVSAEVMQAFFTLDKGIKNTNSIIDVTNTGILGGIQKQAEAYKSDENDAFLARARQADSLTTVFVNYVDEVRKELFAAAGGPSEKNPDIPRREKDKDVTTRLFVMTPPTGKGKGPEIETKIQELRTAYLDIVENNPQIASSLPLEISEDWKKSDKNSWADFTFMQMPVAAVFPILRKIENDARASNTAVLNFLFDKVKGEDIIFDNFIPVVSAPKGYVIRGEKYVADVFLSAYSSAAGDNTKILVNGASLQVKDGKAHYETMTSQIGTKQYKVEIQVTNPLTGEVKSYTQTFEYEVGERSVAVSADKMNVFYVGVENPVSVSAAGVSSNELQVSVTGGGATIKKVGSNNFIIEATTPTDDCRVNVSAPSIGLKDSKVFRVKPFPTPIAKLGNKTDGALGTGEFKAQLGVAAVLENFDFDARCNIQGYTVYRAEPRKDLKYQANQGSRYEPRTQALINEARPGDTYYFQDIKARCPGDKAGRSLNSMVFQIR